MTLPARGKESSPPNLSVFDSAPEATPEFDISDPEVLRMLESSQQSHFWFRARNRQILDFLREGGVPPPAKILEVGCGSGTVLAALASAGYRAAGVEMHRELARRAAERSPSARVFSANVLAPPPELVACGPFDAVAFFDVLEHLESPERVLRSCAGLLAAGGSLVGTLPALASLWSDYDEFAGHRLRYDRAALAALFARADLPAPRAAYFFQTLLPGMLLRRMLVGRGRAVGDDGRRAAQHRALDAPGPFWNAALSAACAVERGIRRAVPLDSVPGASLWFAARIPAPDEIRSETPPTARIGGAP